MKSKRSWLNAVMAIGVVMTACTHPSQQVASPVVSFHQNILPILVSSCAISGACHLGSANQGVNFDSSYAYSTIVKKNLVSVSHPSSSLLYTQIATGAMPLNPYPKLSASQQQLLLLWITQGAKNN